MSSNNDFNGPSYGSARGRGADDNSGGAYGGTGAAVPDGQSAASPHAGSGAVPDKGARRPAGAKYPAAEGWGDDGFWRDSAIDSDYETGTTSAVRPDAGPRDEPGYSYWADGKGWKNSPAKSARADDATSLDAARDAAGPGAPGNGTRTGYRNRSGNGAGGDPTAFYEAGSDQTAFHRSPGGPGGPGRGPGGSGRGPGGRGPGGRGPGQRGPGSSKRKRKGSWWRHWTWKKVGAVTGGLLVIFAIAMFGVYQYLASTTVIPSALASADYQSTQVYYSDGKTLIGTIGTYNRHNLTYSQIPKVLQNAVLAAEDKNFWTEGGISTTGILRAAYHDATSTGSLNGGSTITQEFVRNYYQGIGTNQSMSRKIREIFVAQKLAQVKSKQWILTHYLNVIPLGDHALGVAAAAQTYFGITPDKLNTMTIAQAAVIAGIIQQPGLYPLPAYRKDLIARWNDVITRMVADKFITQAQANAQKFPKLLTDTDYNPNTGASYANEDHEPWVPYVMNVVENELTGLDHVTLTQLQTGGLRVVTTINRPMEVEMYKAVNQNINEIRAEGYKLPAYALIGAELQNPKTGAVLAMYPGRGQNMSPSQCKKYLCDLNTAIYAREQVGSSFKPYVLSTAVSQGMNVKTSILNASGTLYVPPDSKPLTLSTTDQAKKVPGSLKVHNDNYQNFGGAGGAINVQKALALSSNTAFTDLAHRTTTSSIIKMAASMGVNIAPTAQGGSNLSDMVGQVGMALGTASLTVNEQATMLSAIDDNGVYHQSHVIKSWQFAADGTVHTPVIQSHPVLNPDPVTNAQMASQVQYAMEATTVNGTGTNAAQGLGNRQIIGKTGTTTSSHSAFFIGAIPQYSLVVGIFTSSQNTNSPQTLNALGGGGFGGVWPARIWNTFARAEFANLPMQNFGPPVFTGQKWNQVGTLPKPKQKCPTAQHTKHGRNSQVQACPSSSATPTPTPTLTVTPTPTQFFRGRQPAPSSSASGTLTSPGPTGSSTPTP